VQLTRRPLGLLATVGLAAAALAVPAAATAAVSSTPAATPAVTKKLTPGRLASASKAAFVKATSVRARGVGITIKGVVGSMDARISADVCDGVFNLGTIGVVHLRRIGADVWFSGDDALWRTAGIDPAVGRNMWAATTSRDAFWLPVINLCTLTAQAELALPRGRTWVAAPAKVVDKVAGTGIRPTTPAGTVDYVAAKGTPNMLMQVRKTGWTKYQEWNAALNVAPPAPETILP
jgi:hypothetical protein